MFLNTAYSHPLQAPCWNAAPYAPSLSSAMLPMLMMQMMSTRNTFMSTMMGGGSMGGVRSFPGFGQYPGGSANLGGFLGSPAGLSGGGRAGGSSLGRVGGGRNGGNAGPKVKPNNSGAFTPWNHDDSRFKTASINVRSYPLMDQKSVVHDVRKAARQADLIGWNEIAPGRYARAIKDLGPDWGHYMPMDGNHRIPNPISWRKKEWSRISGGFEKVANRKAGVAPSTYITWAKLQHKATDQKVVRINTHVVSGAFGNTAPNRGARQALWHKHIKMLEKRIAKFKKQGYEVIVGGDFNRNRYKVLGDKVGYDNGAWTGTHGGPRSAMFDYLMHVRSPELKSVMGVVDRGYRSDHDAVVAGYKLKAKR